MDSRLDKLKQIWSQRWKACPASNGVGILAGKWCAAEVLEHLYLTYTGTIQGLERVMRKGKPLASRASMAHRALTFVVVGLGHLPAGRKAPAFVQPKGLPAEQARNEIGAKIVAMDAIIAQCEARFGRQVNLLDHPFLGPLDCDTMEKASSGAWTTSPETASPPSRNRDEANGLSAGKSGLFLLNRTPVNGRSIWNGGSMKPTSLVAVLVFLVACFLGSVRAQTHDKKDEIPIERCDRLPVVTMKVAGENRRFLLDTAATTILNLKSFTSGESEADPHLFVERKCSHQRPRSVLARSRAGDAQAARSEAPGD